MKQKLLPILAALAGLFVLYLSFDWAAGAVIHNRKVVAVPDLSGKSVPEALELLSKVNLGITKNGEQFDKRYPAGVIVRQNPSAGMNAREGRTVRVTLSQGGETLFVPDLLGQPLRNAQTLLQNVGLNIGEVERRPSLRFEKDQVMSSDPPGRAVVGKNVLVSLVVSDGPPEGDVLLAPDFVGKSLAEAKKWAASHQVAVSLREENDISRGDGEILSQSPTADTPIRPGESLNLVANTGQVAASGTKRVMYEVPAGANDRDIRVLIIDESGEREVFRRAQAPGSKVDFTVQPKGRARARIFANGIMVEEQEL
jgi:eukaryotic-like serine/threonine-protein kinase